MGNFTRRDLLKLFPALVVGALVGLPHETPAHQPGPALGSPNIIVIVFDALSARHLSLYGYPRPTSPRIGALAECATLYHNHHATANFTTPGTASLLTGTYPWTHRAFVQMADIKSDLLDQNIFRLSGNAYKAVAFARNLYADLLLHRFAANIDELLPASSYCFLSDLPSENPIFARDPVVAFLANEEFLFRNWAVPASPLFGLTSRVGTILAYDRKSASYRDEYPYGIHNLLQYKLYTQLDRAIDGIVSEIAQQTSPFVGYFHFYPPHEPYCPSAEFAGLYYDDWKPTVKPAHPLSEGLPEEVINFQARRYDQFVANLDFEFGRMMLRLKSLGILDNTYVILTADHGQLFERGVHGHVTPLLYEALIHIPLLIWSPGQQTRRDVYTLTSAVDVLPTLLRIIGQELPPTLEGVALPGFAKSYPPDRPIFALEAKENSTRGPLRKATIAMLKGRYKLITYLGYSEMEDVCELYDLASDPEELVDLSRSESEVLSSMKAELDAKLEDADRPYRPL